MPVFTSTRERRLWGWTLAVVVAIYSTIGLARTLEDELRNRELLDNAFVAAFLLVLAAIVTLALGIRPRGLEIGVALGVVAVYALVLVRMALPEHRTHVIEYGVVAILVYEALLERRSQGRDVRAPAVLAVVVATLIGTLDELIQLMVPSRVFDPVDIWVNFVAALLAVVAGVVLGRARREGSEATAVRRP